MFLKFKKIVLMFCLVNVFSLAFGLDLALANNLENQAPFFNLPEEAYDKTFIRPQGDNSLDKVSWIVDSLLTPARFLIGFVAVIYLFVAALKLVASRGEEETAYEGFKRSLMYSLLGLAFFALSGEIGSILSLTGGGIIGSKGELIKRFGIFDTQVGIIITFMKYVIGSVAVLYLAKSGVHMVTAGSNEEDISEDKNTILYTSVALVLLIFSNSLVTKVLYKTENPFDDPSIDLGQGVTEAVGLINLIVSFVGPLAILSLVAAGVLYSLSAANEELRERANKMVKISLFAIILIYGAFGIVSTVISGQIN